MLQNFADPSIRNTEGKTPLDLADPQAKLVLSGDMSVAVNTLHQTMITTGNYRKEDLLEAARLGNAEELMTLLTPLNVNCHAADGRKVMMITWSCTSLLSWLQSTPLHLACGYNRVSVVKLLLKQGADVHAKDKG